MIRSDTEFERRIEKFRYDQKKRNKYSYSRELFSTVECASELDDALDVQLCKCLRKKPLCKAEMALIED